MNLYQKNSEQEVVEAASLLDIPEFKLFKIAYWRWFGRRPGALNMERYFANYMFNAVVPPWVHHLAREVVARAQAGTLRVADYVRQIQPNPAMKIRGQVYSAVLTLICLLLFLAALHYSELLPFVENCYFPPCY